MNSCDLTHKKCVPCEGGVPALKGEDLKDLQKQLKKNWQLIQEHELQSEYVFKDFKSALNFVNQVGELAEREGHHPDIYLSYGKVKIILFTHSIDGLSENDFIIAAKIDLM